MLITINPKSQKPLYEQIVQQIKELVAKGILEEEEQLPSVRDLAAQIVMNPNTVSKAYKELERQGVIVTIRGKGTFVAEQSLREVDPKERQKIQEQLRQLVIEANYANVGRTEMIEWIEKEFEALGGSRDAD
ncbi:GntR family transcriptional regulator [Alkalihalophilus pseudofirmus]|uniref:GntR family transcriptional regulator n=1 Tax=Alkalihalophilus pseudofirmus TaxID=79885 RepID=UPI00259AFCE2|nr:GntR family transcriptional regulator [Alkalihalophilus pseudofirmus]WEG18090.1 GntR family transcriptional regulator [Alkalihalophilus pseudofirmus]